MSGQKLIDLFIPTKRNSYRAKLLQLPSLAILVFVFLLFRTGLTLYSLNRPSVLGYSSEITPQKIINLTNVQREKKGLPPLGLDPTLSEAAQRKAADMFAFNYWSHNSPSGRAPWDFFQEVNYDYTYAGENLARDFQLSSSVVEAWMESPTHRDNILEDNYREIGVAVVDGNLQGVKTTLVVQMFGTPTPATAQAESQPERSAFAPQAAAEAQSQSQTAIEQPVAPEDTAAPVQPSQAKVSRLLVVKVGAATFVGALLLILLLDKLVAQKKQLPRLRGDNMAHIGFLVIILAAIILFRPGAIL